MVECNKAPHSVHRQQEQEEEKKTHEHKIKRKKIIKNLPGKFYEAKWLAPITAW